MVVLADVWKQDRGPHTQTVCQVEWLPILGERATVYPPCLPVAGWSSQVMVMYWALCVGLFAGGLGSVEANSERDISLQDVCEGVPFIFAPVARKMREQN